MENSYQEYRQNWLSKAFISEDEFISGERVAKRLYCIFDKWMQEEKFSELFLKIAECHYPKHFPFGEKGVNIVFVVDVFRLHERCGYSLKYLDRTSIAGLLLAEHYGNYKDLTYFKYKTQLYADNWIGMRTANLLDIGKRAVTKYPGTLFTVEALREIDHNAMNDYIDALAEYVGFIAGSASLDEGKVRDVKAGLELLKSDSESTGRFPEECIETIHPTPPPAPVVEKKKKFSEAAILFTILNVCATVFIVWICCEANGLKIGLLAGGIWFLFGQIGILVAEDVGNHEGSVSSYSSYWPSGDGASSHDASSGGHHDWLDDFDMTKDYYGKHGEFDRYDESRRVSEDIEQFYNCHPDADLSDHYYWDDILDAETDGYLDNKY